MHKILFSLIVCDMDKLIIRFYWIRGINAKESFWQKVEIKEQVANWEGILVVRYLIPEFYYHGKPWKLNKLHELLNEQLKQLEAKDYEYIPYSLFHKNIGLSWREEPKIGTIKNSFWEKIVARFSFYQGIIICEEYSFLAQEWLKVRAIRLKYLAIVIEEVSESLEELAEDIYEELGLQMIFLHPQDICGYPTSYPLLVLDSSKQRLKKLEKMAERSVWLDFQCDNKKRHYIEKRYPHIEYISLKKELESLQYLDSK